MLVVFHFYHHHLYLPYFHNNHTRHTFLVVCCTYQYLVGSQEISESELELECL